MADLKDIRSRERLDTGSRFSHTCVDQEGRPLRPIPSFSEIADIYNEKHGGGMYPALAYSVWMGAIKKLRQRVAEDPNLEKLLIDFLAG